MRTKEELAVLYASLRQWCRDEIGQEFDAKVFESAFDRISTDRLSKFLYKRLGHISDADYFNFLGLLGGDPDPVKVEAVAPTQGDTAQMEQDAKIVQAIIDSPRKRGRPAKLKTDSQD